jgi:hypothetical protein
MTEGACSTHGRDENAFRILVRKLETRRPLDRPGLIYEDNIKTDLKEIGSEGVDQIHTTQHGDQWRALVDNAMNLRVT